MTGVTKTLFMCQMFMCLFWPLLIIVKGLASLPVCEVLPTITKSDWLTRTAGQTMIRSNSQRLAPAE